MAQNSVMIKIEADIRDLQSSLKQVESSLTGLEKSKGAFDGISNSLKGIGGAVASAFAVDKMVGFVGQATQTASELSALDSQYEQVLGNMKGQADKYLDGISKKYNTHPNELKQAMVQYQALLKGKGMSEKDAYDTAKVYLERTVDATAFNNGTMAENTERFMGVIKGEYDSVDTAMVNMSQTMLNDTAVKEYGKKWDELSVSQQEHLKTSIAVKQHMSSGVMGQGVREAQSYQVSLAMLKSTWTDLLADFGSPIIEALAPKLQALTQGLDSQKIKEMGTAFGEFLVKVMDTIPKIVDLGVKFAPLIAGILGTVGAMKTMGTAVAVFDKVKNGMGLLSTTMGLLKANVGGLKGAFSILSGALKLPFLNPWTVGIGIAIAVGVLLYQHWDEVKACAISLWESIKSVFGAMGSFLGGVMSSIGTAVSSGITAVVNFFVTGFQSMVQTVTTIFTTIGQVIQVALMFIGNIISFAVQLLLIPWMFIWENFKGVIIPVFESIKSAISTALSFIGSIIISYLTMVYTFWSTIFKTIFNVVKTVFTAIKGVISAVLSAVFGGVSSGWNRVLSIVISVGSAIGSAVSSVWNNVKSVVSSVSNAIKSVVSTAWNGIKGVIVSVGSGIKSAVSSVFNGVKSTISGVMNTIHSIVSSAFNKIKSIFNTVLKPNIKLPHINISGKFSLNPPQAPKMNVSWYKTGGIFTGASVVGVGESGDEAVVPLSNKRRMKPFASAVASMIDTNNTGGGDSGGTTINISQMVVREDADIKRIAEELDKLSKRNNRKMGLV